MASIKHLRISVTNECNNNCWYCHNEGLNKKNIYLSDMDSFKWLISRVINRYGVNIVRFTGGEPLLNPSIANLIEIVKDCMVKIIGLTTNGMLLSDYYEKINKIIPIQYSISVHQVDNSLCDIKEVIQFISNLIRLVKNARFNIVVTRKNIEIIKQILKYSVEQNVNLLLLDLLQAKNDLGTFSNNHCNLNELKNILYNEYGLSCNRQNKNSYIYSNETMSIKIVDNYVSGTNYTRYCTKQLFFNPILISSDFTITVCNHFGKKAFSTAEAVNNQDEKKLFSIIDNALSYLASCNECNDCEILTDHK
jgi:cyclic pyranopterin phosphate synthase